MNPVVIGITMGDPAGIGPEIIVKALSELKADHSLRPLVIGDRRSLDEAMRITGLMLPIQTVVPSEFAHARILPVPGEIALFDLENADPREIPPGQLSPLAGKAAYQYIEAAVQLALKHQIDAIVTAPINKAALNSAGYHESGHTEILARLTGTKSYAMMLVVDDFRIIHVTTHVALRKACDLITKERVYQVIRLAHVTGKQLGIIHPAIGVAGLNPHAGEGGLFGDEELREIIPAIELAQLEGMNVEGPVPPDTVFVKARSGLYDFVVAMYHDQGHIPLKMAGFVCDTGGMKISGVNVTLGLPIIRTSVDHGTAFDQVGKGTANAKSMSDAIQLAVQMARQTERG